MRRLLITLALAGVAATLGGCSQRLVATDLDASEAQRCAIVLRAAGLDVLVDRDESAGERRQRLAVRGDDADYRTALQLLEERGLPRRAVDGFATESSSIIPSPTEERARYIKGLSGEIAGMLEGIDGVVSADVLVSLPERRPLSPSPDEASASAVVAHVGDASPVSADEVRAIVVRGVGASLSPERVAVVLKPVVRPGASKPVVRYERDRVTEIGFLAAVCALAAAETITVWLMRARRRSTASERFDG